MAKRFQQNSSSIEKKDITQDLSSSAVANIALAREEKNKTRSYYLVTHPTRNPAEQGLPLLGGRDAVLSLWYYDSTLGNFFF